MVKVIVATLDTVTSLNALENKNLIVRAKKIVKLARIYNQKTPANGKDLKKHRLINVILDVLDAFLM